jgi:hypothetical protein
VVGAGNRAHDSAIVRPMYSALLNRMVHVHLLDQLDTSQDSLPNTTAAANTWISAHLGG